MRTLDRLSAQLFRRGSGGPDGVTQWQFSGGEQNRSNDVLELSASGARRADRDELQAARLSARRGEFSGGIGDNEPIAIGRLARLERLRGGVLRYARRDENRWVALGGIPTPVPRAPTSRLRIGGLLVEGLPLDRARLALGVMGFGRGRASPAPSPTISLDSLPGGGGLATLGWRAPALRGTLAGSVDGQLHDLDGPRALAAQELLEWSYASPGLVATLSDARGTRGVRLLGTDRFTPGPRREERWNVQRRFIGGRAESHCTGVLRDGGDAALVTRTLQCGASGNLGHSAWYGGADAVWDWRTAVPMRPGTGVRRVSLQAGGLLPRANALLMRLEYAEDPGASASLSAQAEAALSLPLGARLELEPRCGWSERVIEQGRLTSRLSCGLGALGARLTGSVAVGAERDQRFRGAVREAAIAVSCSPRARDRSQFELRRLDLTGRPATEYSAGYDAIVERYPSSGEWTTPRDTGRVAVRVVRAGDGSGVPEVLVSLDGRALSFTDADGVAHFDHVPSGIHTVAIEEHSLPANHHVLDASRMFVTVESGRVPDPVTFTIARAERRTRF